MASNSKALKPTNAPNAAPINNDLEDGEIDDLSDDLIDIDLGPVDSEILKSIPPEKIKLLSRMTETQREKELYKLLEKFETEQRRSELRKKISSQESAAGDALGSQDNLAPRAKISKWSTETDLADLEALDQRMETVNSPRKKPQPDRQQKSTETAQIFKHRHVSSSSGHFEESNQDDEFFRSAKKPEKQISCLEDLQKLRLSRTKLVKSLFMPYLKKLATGAIVKANIGIPGAQSQGYQIVRIVDIVDSTNNYQVDGVLTNKSLKIAIGKNVRVIKILFVSNSPIDKSDYAQWLETMKRDGVKLPTLKEVKQKRAEIDAIIHYTLTDKEVQQVVNEKNKFRKKPINLALTKSEIEKQIAEAGFKNDQRTIDLLLPKLYQIEKECEVQINKQNTRVAGLVNLNKRNRQQNLINSTEKNGRENMKEAEEMNPFKRQNSRPSVIANKHTVKSAKDRMQTPTAADDNIDQSNNNNNSAESKNKENSEATKTLQNLHDFDVSIDLGDM